MGGLEKGRARPLATEVNGDLGHASVKGRRKSGKTLEDHPEKISLRLAGGLLGHEDDRAFRLEVHLHPGGHGNVGFGTRPEAGVIGGVKIPHLAPEADDRAHIGETGPADGG
jgi:hypothetical protein